jgi:hypothetical protein
MNVPSFVAERHGRRTASFVLATLLSVSCGFEVSSAGEKSPQQPKYGSRAVRMFHARQYLRENEAPDFWALMPYYVHQFSERACSVASTTMVVNAARAQSELMSDDELVSQKALLRRVSYPRWNNAIQEGGRGVTIEDLGHYLTQALELYCNDEYEVDAVRVDASDDGLHERVRKMLIENERTDDDFVIVFFWQATFTDDPEGKTGHVAPIGAYDEENERALILDPDRDWYEPYWVPLDVLVEGMARRDPDTGRSRGYIWVRKHQEFVAHSAEEEQ